MIKRSLYNQIISSAKSFPAIAILGPRQSGKTTLAKQAFPKKPYALLEDPDTQEFAIKDPRGFLAQFPKGAILDEIQNVPHLFSYLQGVLDKKNTPGLFILTGSQNFLLMEKITQSLAGRIALLTLLPLSLSELKKTKHSFPTYEDYLINGFYPRLYDQTIPPKKLYANYVQTYLQRDIRLLKNVHNLSTFHTFLKMCALRCGQLLNLSSLSIDCGITHTTAKSWISLLETSYIIYLLQPHHKNFKKRLVKMPKLYFYDTGLAAYLSGIQNKKHLANHPSKGALFETLIITELLKKRFNEGNLPNLYFWRDKTGHEIDCVLENADTLTPIEIKSGRTISTDYFKNLNYWNNLAKNSSKNSFVVYGNNTNQQRSSGTVVSWKNFTEKIS